MAASYAGQRVLSGVEFHAGFTFDQPVQFAFGLHAPLLFSEGFFWQPLTHMFLHASWLHLLCNAVALLCLGAAVEPALGARRFVALFLGAGVLGGLAWAVGDGLWHLRADATLGLCVGASGGVYGLAGACAALNADRVLRVWFFFVPLRLRGKWLAVVIVLLTAADAALGLTNFAHAAHLGGFAAGWMFGSRWRRRVFGEDCADAV